MVEQMADVANPPQRLTPPTNYDTNLSEHQWGLVKPLMPKPHSLGRKHSVNFREVVNAILYHLKKNVPLRQMAQVAPDFPPIKTVNYYFVKWRLDGTWAKIRHALGDDPQLKIGEQKRTRRSVEIRGELERATNVSESP